VVKKPVGPVAAFTPWNFPINQMVRKLDGLEAGTGPMANPRRITAMETFIGDATQRGATVQIVAIASATTATSLNPLY
jgi:delta 1-pyrroline-5-carboxylate dehydrogenase